MKVVRGPRPDRFTVIDNRVIRDHRLSFRARGLLIDLLSQRDGWETDSTRLAEHATGKKGDKREGRDAIRAALRELEELGYVAYERTQAPGRRGGKVWRTVMVVRDVPASGFPAYPWEGSPDPGPEIPSSGGDDHHPEPENPSPGRPADITDGHDQSVSPEDGFFGVGVAGPLTKDYDEQLKAAASGDHHHQSGEESAETGRNLAPTSPGEVPAKSGRGRSTEPEPHPDVIKVLKGCGVSPHAKAWTEAATQALARGGNTIEIIGHVMEPVTGEPRSIEAIRLTRLRTWTGKPSPRTPGEVLAELRTDHPPKAPTPREPTEPGRVAPTPRRTPHNPPDEPTDPPMTPEERQALHDQAREFIDRHRRGQAQPKRPAPARRREATDDDRAEQERQVAVFDRYVKALADGCDHDEAARRAYQDDGQPPPREGSTP